jgi:glycosyltransferase involved in cell wall biosynthesis
MLRPSTFAAQGAIDLTLFVSCFNESPRVADTLATIREAMKEVGCSYEVIVTDDGSTDDTAGVVERFMHQNPEMPISLHRNARNFGLARSFVDAAFVGKGRYFRMVWGDNVEPKETLVAILKQMGEADVIIPYYPVVPGRGPLRMVLSRAYTALVNIVSGHALRYYNGSALFVRYDVMRWAPNSAGFTGFLADLITHLLDEGATYKEIAVVGRHVQKEKANTPLTARNVASTLHTLVEVTLRRLRRTLFESRPR